MNMHRPSCVVVTSLVVTQMLSPAALWAADQRGIRVEANRRVLISAISGEQLTAQNGGDSKALHFRDAVSAGDQVTTGDRTVADVLIGNRAVVTLGQSTTAQFAAVSEEQTTVQVKNGIVRVAASALALGEQGKVTVQTPTGQVQTRGGIIRVMVDTPVGSAEFIPIGDARPYLASYSPNMIVAAVTTRGEIIQVEEGTAEILGAGPGGAALTVKSGQAVTLQSGQAGSVSGLVTQGGMRTGVVASAGHTSTPKEGVDNLVALQIDQATALGKALTGAAETGAGDSGGKDESKNAINGATGGVTLAGLSGLIFQQPPSTSGTLTFQNSNFTVSGALAFVDAAVTDSRRDANDRVISATDGGVALGAPSTRLTVSSFSGTAGTQGDTIPAGTQVSNSSGTFQAAEIYRNSGASLNASYSLKARISNTQGGGTGVRFSDGVNILNSTLTGTGSSLIVVDGSNSTQSTTPNVTFNQSALSVTGSTLNGTIQSLFVGLGREGTSEFTPTITTNIVAASSARSLVGLVDSNVTAVHAVILDHAVLQASAPLIALYGTVVGDPANNRTTMTTNGDFASLANSELNVSGGLPGGALASLNAATLVVRGNFLTLGAGSTLTASTLAYLTNQSVFQVQGALVNFNGGGTLNLTGVCGTSCQNITGTSIPVMLTGGATLSNNTFAVAAGYNAFTGTGAAAALSANANRPLLTVNGAGNTVRLGL